MTRYQRQRTARSSLISCRVQATLLSLPPYTAFSFSRLLIQRASGRPAKFPHHRVPALSGCPTSQHPQATDGYIAPPRAAQQQNWGSQSPPPLFNPLSKPLPGLSRTEILCAPLWIPSRPPSFKIALSPCRLDCTRELELDINHMIKCCSGQKSLVPSVFGAPTRDS